MTLAAVLALGASALLFGGMAFFSAVMAPLIFMRLELPVAAGFIRAVFPVYYLFVAGAAGLAGVAFLPFSPVDAAVMLAVALGAILARQVLMPRINALRDRQVAGDASAGRAFDRSHALSVAINAAQLFAAGVVLVRFAMGYALAA